MIAVASLDQAGLNQLAQTLSGRLAPRRVNVVVCDGANPHSSRTSLDDPYECLVSNGATLAEDLTRQTAALADTSPADGPEPVVIAIGAHLLQPPDVSDSFDLRLFIATPRDACLRAHALLAGDDETSGLARVRAYCEGPGRSVCDRYQITSAYRADITFNADTGVEEIADRVVARLEEIERRSIGDTVDEVLARLAKAPPGDGLRRRVYWRKRAFWVSVIAGAKGVKRVTDILCASLALVLFLPFTLLIALAIKLTDGGPIFFVQKRVGKWGREFPFPKFRTMVTNAEALKQELLDQNKHREGVTFKMMRDPRVTWIGRILRKTSLDEFPQFWSVLKGDMTLVGPRPPVPEEVDCYTLRDRRRLDVTPGLTCIWQVSGRSEIPFPRQVELDVQYIESQSLWLDIKLLIKTVPAVLLGRGAY